MRLLYSVQLELCIVKGQFTYLASESHLLHKSYISAVESNSKEGKIGQVQRVASVTDQLSCCGAKIRLRMEESLNPAMVNNLSITHSLAIFPAYVFVSN